MSDYTDTKPTEFTYNLHPVRGFSNVHMYAEKDLNSSKPVRMDNRMGELVNILRLKRPTWEFYGARANQGSGSDDYIFRDMEVYDGDEKLGRIWWGWNRGGNAHCYANFRVRNERRRGNHAFSKDPKVAAKGILEMFATKSPTERATFASAAAREKLNEVVMYKSCDFRKKSEMVEGLKWDYLLPQWDAVVEFAANRGITVDPDAPAAYETYTTTQAISSCYTKGAAFVFSLESDGRWLVTARDVEPSIVATDKLAPHYRMCLGMLKLTDIGTAIADVGMRVGDNLFVIVAGVSDDGACG